MMLELSYVYQDAIRFESIATTKELFEVPYVQAEVREYLREMCDRVAERSVPPLLVIASSGFENIENTGEEEVSWDENYSRSALTLVLHMIPLDTSLIDKLCHVFAAADPKVKKFIIGTVKANQISINDDNLLYAIDNCPPGGVSLIARFVTLLTDRGKLFCCEVLFSKFSFISGSNSRTCRKIKELGCKIQCRCENPDSYYFRNVQRRVSRSGSQICT